VGCGAEGRLSSTWLELAIELKSLMLFGMVALPLTFAVADCSSKLLLLRAFRGRRARPSMSAQGPTRSHT